MKSRRILGLIAATGMVVSTMAATVTMGTSSAIADEAVTNEPAWGQRCDRNWDTPFCNPKAKGRGRPAVVNPGPGGAGVTTPGASGPIWNDDSRDDGWYEPIGGREVPPRNRIYSYRSRLSAGTRIPAYPERQRRVVVRRYEEYPLTLVVGRDVGGYTRRGRAVLPSGSRITGALVPYRDGYRYESEYVRLPYGGTRQISAVSNTLDGNGYDRFDRNDDDVNVSNGALVILGSVLGRRSGSYNSGILGDVFNRYPNSRRDLAVIYPDQSLDLRLTRDFVIN